jgi:hypothetical protein
MAEPTQRHYAEMPMKSSEDFRAICDKIRRSLNANADAIHFTSRVVAAKLKKYEKKIADKRRAELKRQGAKKTEIWKVHANYARARFVAGGLRRVARLQRTSAKLTDRAWRRFLRKYGDEILGGGAPVLDHEPRQTTRRSA